MKMLLGRNAIVPIRKIYRKLAAKVGGRADSLATLFSQESQKHVCEQASEVLLRLNALPRGCTQPAHIDNILSVVQSKAF